MIPWSDIVKATPSIINAAKSALDGRGARPEPVVTNADRITETTPADEAIDLLREDITVLRGAITGLQEDQARSGRLLRELAEQNARLSEAVLKIRVQLRLSLTLTPLALAVAAAALWLALR